MHYLVALILSLMGLAGVTPANVNEVPASIKAPASASIVASSEAKLPSYLPKVATSKAPATPQVQAPSKAPEVGVPALPATTQPVRCEEDEPCWDCKTMGNKQCGPVISDDQPERCEEDEPCWDCATMGNLQCGPSATMEQDAIGSFVSQTGMETTNEARSLTLEYVSTQTSQPSKADLPTGEFVVQSSNLDNTWHIVKWASFTHA